MKTGPATEVEQQVLDHQLAVAAVAAALFGPSAVRACHPVPGRGPGAWLREGLTAMQSSHRTAAPLIGPARERGTTQHMKLWIQVEGRPYEVEVDTTRPASARRPSSAPVIPESVLRPRPTQKLPEDSVCRTPIAGRVVALLVEPGTAVRRNQPVVLIEAMKMEVPIGPAVDGVVKSIHVEAGQTVAARQTLFDLD